ncbi:major tail protein [Mycobacterium phage AFIS]|nr:major tail protein [Mycobacterium phage AFIS]
MALKDDAVLIAARGYVYTAAVGTAAPTPSQLKLIDLEHPEAWDRTGWDLVGHTSEDDLPEFGFDGGDSEVRGSWQKKKLREVETEEIADYVVINLTQFDESALELYFGPNQSATPGIFGVKSGSVVNERALLIVIVDNDVRLGFHARKASLKREDAISLATDEFGALPVRATFLDYQSYNLYEWIEEDWFNAADAPVVYLLDLGGATGGDYTLLVGGKSTGDIAYNANASAIKTAIGAVDDGVAESAWTVTADGSDFEISGPLAVALGVDSTTGGSGVTVDVA